MRHNDNASYLSSITDESREPDSVVIEHAGRHRGYHHACDNGSDAVPVFSRHPVADNYVEQHRCVCAVDCHVACQCGSERGNERADDVSTGATEHNYHGCQYWAAIECDAEHWEVRRRGCTDKTIPVNSHLRYKIGIRWESLFAIGRILLSKRYR